MGGKAGAPFVRPLFFWWKMLFPGGFSACFCLFSWPGSRNRWADGPEEGGGGGGHFGKISRAEVRERAEAFEGKIQVADFPSTLPPFRPRKGGAVHVNRVCEHVACLGVGIEPGSLCFFFFLVFGTNVSRHRTSGTAPVRHGHTEGGGGGGGRGGLPANSRMTQEPSWGGGQ